MGMKCHVGELGCNCARDDAAEKVDTMNNTCAEALREMINAFKRRGLETPVAVELSDKTLAALQDKITDRVSVRGKVTGHRTILGIRVL